MKKVLAIVVVVSACAMFWFIDKIDQYETQARCYNINDDIVTFETDNGNLYEWQVEDNQSFVEGNTYILVMKDYENGNELDDAIVRIK